MTLREGAGVEGSGSREANQALTIFSLNVPQRIEANFIHRAHVKCGEIAPKDCGQRPARPLVHASSAAKGGKPASPQR